MTIITIIFNVTSSNMSLVLYTVVYISRKERYITNHSLNKDLAVINTMSYRSKHKIQPIYATDIHSQKTQRSGTNHLHGHKK